MATTPAKIKSKSPAKVSADKRSGKSGAGDTPVSGSAADCPAPMEITVVLWDELGGSKRSNRKPRPKK